MSVMYIFLFVVLECVYFCFGFVVLSDVVLLIVVQCLNFGVCYGFMFELSCQLLWVVVCDKLFSGEFDVVYVFYGFVCGLQFGIGGLWVDMVVLMVLNCNGQVIMLLGGFVDVYCEIVNVCIVFVMFGCKLLFVQIFLIGMYVMWLNVWFVLYGVDLLCDVCSVVILLFEMVVVFVGGEFDGFCVGELWYVVVEVCGVGCIVVVMSEIWFDYLEKVFVIWCDFVVLYLVIVCVLVCMLVDVCVWFDSVVYCCEVVDWFVLFDVFGVLVWLIVLCLFGDYGVGLFVMLLLLICFYDGGVVNWFDLCEVLWFLL